MQPEVIVTLVATAAGILTACLLVWLWIEKTSPKSILSRSILKEADGAVTFLFDEETLIDATPRARALFSQNEIKRSDWESFLALMSGKFPDLRSKCKTLASEGNFKILAKEEGDGWLTAEYWNGLARFTLAKDTEQEPDPLASIRIAAMERELETLRCIGENAPQLIWARDFEGEIIWANRAYLELTEALTPAGMAGVRTWPPPDIFSHLPPPPSKAPVVDMHKIIVPADEKPIWYEVTALNREADTIFFAIDASATVFAQETQRSFVQTLTKTFAQLSVGLAIFDSDRRLVLFNPAIIELTELTTEFLISRPTLFSFLDRLRDQQMIPEPKDYASWRDRMAALESAAIEGSYNELWLLPSGQTFRVTGKPHPNGAIAFLFEDISDDVSVTHKYRLQVEIGRAVINTFPHALAVFNSSGALVLSNTAYQNLWAGEAEQYAKSRTILDEVSVWEETASASPVWQKIQTTLRTENSPKSWAEQVTLNEKTPLICSYTPLKDGHHQFIFSTPDESPQFTDEPISESITRAKNLAEC